jgi:hypothetical protein
MFFKKIVAKEINVELMVDNVTDYRRSSLSKLKSSLPNKTSFLMVASTFMAACSDCAAYRDNSRCYPVVASTGA